MVARLLLRVHVDRLAWAEVCGACKCTCKGFEIAWEDGGSAFHMHGISLVSMDDSSGAASREIVPRNLPRLCSCKLRRFPGFGALEPYSRITLVSCTFLLYTILHDPLQRE